jgi:hypothetical protein
MRNVWGFVSSIKGCTPLYISDHGKLERLARYDELPVSMAIAQL